MSISEKLKLSEKDLQVAEVLKTAGISFEIFIVGELAERNSWKCDRFSAVFTKGGVAEAFEYSQGIGHRVTYKPLILKTQPDKYQSILLANKQEPTIKPHKNAPSWDQKQYIPKPTAASVLYCLLLDAGACVESFKGWCANFGYSEDSRKALEVYMECQSIGQRLGFLNGVKEQLNEILENY